MSSVLIDNSTLTSIQRLSGTAPAPRSYDPQGDYAAFEAFATTLMFNDSFYYIDDYKEAFRASRADEFRFVRAVGMEEFPYSDVEFHAKELTEGLLLDIRAGRMEPGVIKEFLESVGLHLTAAWQMQSSDFFLTLKILADEPNDWDVRYKYSPLSALIFDQSLGREVEANDAALRLVGSDGKDVVEREEGKRKYAIGGDIQAFAASLNWMTWRTAFYALSASHFNATVSLHPIRHTFLSRWTADRNVLSNSENWRTRFSGFFGDQATETINRINETADATEIGLHLPLFAAWAVGRTGTVRDAVSFLLDVRVSPDAVAVRQKMAEIDELRSGRAGAKWKVEANRLALAVRAESTDLIRKFGADHGTAPVVSMNAELGVPPKFSVGVEAEVGDLGLKFGSARRVRGLFRNIVNDVVGFDGLGDVRSALLRQVRKSEDHTIPALPIEERRYAGRNSDWKQKM
jgi:hypothetical protein